MKIKWNRSVDNHIKSKCGKFGVSPLYCGTTRAQFYEAYQVKPHTVISGTSETQQEAKEDIEAWRGRKAVAGGKK